MQLSNKLFQQGNVEERLKFMKFYGRYGDLIKQYEAPLPNIIWHSGGWSYAATPSNDKTLHLFVTLLQNWTLLPNLTFTQMHEVPI